MPKADATKHELSTHDRALLDLVIGVLHAVAMCRIDPTHDSWAFVTERYDALVRFPTGGDPEVERHLADTPALVHDDLRAWIERGTMDLGDLSDVDKGEFLIGMLRAMVRE